MGTVKGGAKIAHDKTYEMQKGSRMGACRG